jgi:hypothetical protein
MTKHVATPFPEMATVDWASHPILPGCNASRGHSGQ